MTIPPDILSKAEALYSKYKMDCFDGREAGVKAIAEALMEERERCAQRFLVACDLLAEDNQGLSIFAITTIGRAIRSPDKNEAP